MQATLQRIKICRHLKSKGQKCFLFSNSEAQKRTIANDSSDAEINWQVTEEEIVTQTEHMFRVVTASEWHITDSSKELKTCSKKMATTKG